MFWPTDVDLGSVYAQSGYDLILILGGFLWLSGTLLLMIVVHRTMAAEHAQVTAEEGRATELTEQAPARTARAA
jgi:cbb3-type cytochrome oxidase subunit 1